MATAAVIEAQWAVPASATANVSGSSRNAPTLPSTRSRTTQYDSAAPRKTSARVRIPTGIARQAASNAPTFRKYQVAVASTMPCPVKGSNAVPKGGA